MFSNQLVQTQIKALLKSADATSFAAVVGSLQYLAANCPHWSYDDKRSACMHRLVGRHPDVSVSTTVTDDDFADASLLLGSNSVRVLLTDAKQANLDSVFFADELRYAAVALSAASMQDGRISQLLRHDLANSVLLDAIWNESYLVPTGVRVTCAAIISVDRVFVGRVVESLQRGLDEFSVERILRSAEPSYPKRLKFAAISALARYAVLSCQRHESS
ncbi:MAG: hypothetical protein JST44_24930 [Cyanobacteria bacterium SZAS LIN-5]|nr:hypothetical protein [Cyanobacteria bacterium SZAS LIN-5]